MANQFSRSGADALPRQLGASDSSAMVREAKGLALEFKSLLKRKEPWDRDLEFQRESLRKAYLRVIFSPASDRRPDERSRTDVLRSRTSSSTSLSSTSPTRRLDTLNLLWLDTTHALITSYRGRLAELDRQIAAAPKGHKNKNRDRNQIGNGGDILPAAVGPVARRKLIHSFRQFLGKEEEFWRTLCGRFASRLYPEEAAELRSVGIVATSFLSANDSGLPESHAVPDHVAQETERDRLRAGVLPLAHKALICFGDLARYSELYSETSAGQPPVESHKGRGRGGRRGGNTAGNPPTDRRIKTYTKAAECYSQARLLLPDNGNPSNQLAVLAQYAADPLSSIYHYYRALCVRSPFATAKANLRITFSKAVARWFAPDGGEPDGDDAERFKAAFIALHGIFFTKQQLSELATLSLRLQDLFRTVIAERLLVSDAVIKVVTTSLAALWDSRMSRSTLSRSKNGSTVAPQASSTSLQDAAAPTTKHSLEPQILLHVVSMLKILLARSTIETIELLESNESQRGGADQGARVPAAQNISAVLRRALPAIRVLTKWLVSQLDYVSRVHARVEASERRRHRVSNGDEAQHVSSLESSAASRESSDPTRVSLEEFRTGLDSLWLAYADFANILKVAFPQDELPLDLLDEGVWLEEDVELLGFVPLRWGMKGTAGEANVVSAREIRRVGRDVHPNDEQLMRVADVLRDAVDLAESHVTGLSLQNGVFTCETQQPPPIANAVAEPGHQVEGEEVEDEDEEMLDELTEDDPVDRAMRVATASKLGLSDYSADEDEEDEEVVYAGNRSASLTPARSPLQPSMALPQPVQATPSPRTAADLRQLLLSGGTAPPPLTGPIAHSSAPAPPPLTRTGSHPSSSSISNIWAPTSGPTSSSSPLLLGGNIFATPGSTAPHAKPVTPHSFEAIPNLTHGTRAAHAAGWLTNATPAAAAAAAGAEAGSGSALPPAVGLGAMYDGAFAPIAVAMAARSASASATSPHAPPGAAYPPPSFQHHQQPPPVMRPPLQAHASLPSPMSSAANNEVPRLSTAFAGLPQRNNHSDLSPFAPTFGAAGGGGYFAGANANAKAGRGGPVPPQPPARSNGWG
ncbi:hypothetical protein RHOSPDRAFT_24132 [Rhodotorula sp. JG-1b]|nr:hypothetical protein RHOSPDRAFT_24132 [Rhodotorula sp. JG-1b]